MTGVNYFDFSNKVAVITGGVGMLLTPIAIELSKNSAKVAIIDINQDATEAFAKRLKTLGGEALAIHADVKNKDSLLAARETILHQLGEVDILINGAGGNSSYATTSEAYNFFELPEKAIRDVIDLNFLGVLFASQVFGEIMAKNKTGSILNIASMAAIRPLTRTVAYSAAKAAVKNFTEWLAIYMSQNYSSKIRVNALAPGFFMTEQNRYLLLDQESGNLTNRGSSIISHTPMGRFGLPEDLVLSALWLVSESASFVHGVTVPVDGGFSIYSGV